MAASDIKVVADFTDLQLMRRELVGVSKDAKASAGVFEREFNKVSNALSRSAKTSQSYYNETLKVDRASKSAAQSASAMEKALLAQERANAKAAAAAAKSAREQALANRRLRMEFKEGYAAKVQLRAAQMRLNQARKQGIITDEQYTTQLGTLAATTQLAGRRMNSTGMAMQQVGYQAGDFLVQVQSGTNAMVAFGQQATQLVGILPMFSSFMGLSGNALIALSAGLGIAIPLLTAIGAAFMRTRPPAEKAKTTFEGVKDALDKIEEVNFDDLGKEFLDTAKEIREEFSNILGIIEDVARKDLEESLTAPLKAVIADLESFEARASMAAQIQAGAPDFGGQFGLDSRNEALFLATQLAKLDGETKEELQGQLEAISEALYFRGILTDEVKETLVQLASELSLMESITETSQDMLEASKAVADNQQILKDGATSFLSIWDGIVAKFGEGVRELNSMVTAVQKLEEMRFEFSAGGRAMALYGGRGTVSDRPIEGDLPEGYGETPSTRSRSGGGAGGQTDNKLEALIASLQTEQETLEAWYSTQKDLLAQFNDDELSMIGGQEEAKLRLQQDYSDKLVQLKQRESQLVSGSARGMYSDLVGLLNMFAGKSKAAAIASIALTKGLRIAEVIASGAAAQVRALAELGPIAGAAAAAKIGAFTKIQAGIIAATGLAQAASLGGGGSVGGIGGGSNPSGSQASVPNQATATPQRVIIEGIDRNSLISGEQLSNIFEALYKENENRGFVFEVAR